MTNRVLPTGATIGILGGGQLGRMTALAASALGLRTHIYCPEADAPAGDVTRWHTVAAYDDTAALKRFAQSVDAVTLEFENIPPTTLETLSGLVPVMPGAACLDITQDRLKEKEFAVACGMGTAPFAAVDSLAALQEAVSRLGMPSILKTRRFGYDGKGQVRLLKGDAAECAAAWQAIGQAPAILEGMVSFTKEVSVLVARGQDGAMGWYPVTENRHEQGILATSTVPAGISPAVASRATGMAVTLAEKMGIVGLLAVEMFVLPDGSLLMNEMAPRPHNSFHWTMDGAFTGQFEQLVRIAAGWPLGNTALRGRGWRMENLLGDTASRLRDVTAHSLYKAHWYGKRDAAPGRKMGHITRETGGAC
jgi:5-(carboxyamino)imidazole ribonucleotide synthase